MEHSMQLKCRLGLTGILLVENKDIFIVQRHEWMPVAQAVWRPTKPALDN